MHPPNPHPIRDRVTVGFFVLLLLAFFANYALIALGVFPDLSPPRGPDRPPFDWSTLYPFGDPASAPPRDPVPPPPPAAPLAAWKAAAGHATARADDFARDNALFRIPFSAANMAFRRAIGMRHFAEEGVLRLRNGHLVRPRLRLDMDGTADQIAAFHAFCAKHAIPFLFVLAPHQTDRAGRLLPFGAEDFAHDNADCLLEELARRNVPVLDLRPELETAFTNRSDAFFRTDHHWTPEAGLWAAGRIARELDLPGADFAPAAFRRTVYPRLFLGSLGKKVTHAYAPPEDFTLVTPAFATDLSLDIPRPLVQRRGTFRETMITARHLAATNWYHLNPYAAYLGGDYALLRIANHRRPAGPRLLVIKNSFANVVLPFLALTAESVDAVDLRHFSGSLQTFAARRRPAAAVMIASTGALQEVFPDFTRSHAFRLE